ncbi:MAG: 3'(2'),5'-bisphosphate nucleotidase CysQ [Parashewanella sp.]
MAAGAINESQAFVESIIDVAMQAGTEVKAIFQQGNFEKCIKEDHTPVTSADLASHELIIKRLQSLTPDIPILSEEDANIPLSIRQQWQRYWLVDPLDGTGEFIAGSGDFAVLIALVENNKPTLGVVYAPMRDICYYAMKGQGAFKREHGQQTQIISQHVKDQHSSLTIAVSRRQNPQTVLSLFQSDYEHQLIRLGGAALKSCLVAEGKADCYVRIGPTGEWDTGAAQVILEEAGGTITDLQLNQLSYNQRESLENPNFIAIGRLDMSWEHRLITPSE